MNKDRLRKVLEDYEATKYSLKREKGVLRIQQLKVWEKYGEEKQNPVDGHKSNV